jgi:hypothetical protein
METLFAIVTITTVLYILFRIIEMKVLKKEMKPVKELVYDAVIVAFSSALSVFLTSSMSKSVGGFLNAVTEQPMLPASAPVFTDPPGF